MCESCSAEKGNNISIALPRLSLPRSGMPAGHPLRTGFLRAGWPHAAGRQGERRGEKSCRCCYTPGPPVLPVRKTKDVFGRRHTHAPPRLRREGGRDCECLCVPLKVEGAGCTAACLGVCFSLLNKQKKASFRAHEITQDCCGHVRHTINRTSYQGLLGEFQKAFWEMKLNRNCSDRLNESPSSRKQIRALHHTHTKIILLLQKWTSLVRESTFL